MDPSMALGSHIKNFYCADNPFKMEIWRYKLLLMQKISFYAKYLILNQICNYWSTFLCKNMSKNV